MEPVEVLSSTDEDESSPPKKLKLTKVMDSEPSKSKNSEHVNDKNGRSGNRDEANLAEITSLYDSSEEVHEMLQLCYKKINIEKPKATFMAKVRLLKKHYDALGSDYMQSDDFKREMQRRLETCKTGHLAIVLQMFVELFTELETASKRLDHSDRDNRAIRKLEKFLKRIHKRIVQLEEAEVDFGDEENSSYLQVQRYRDRAVKVYEKLCKFRKEKSYAGNITKCKIDFSGSDNVEINRAINKAFKDGSKFPTYYDLEQCIRKCVKKNGMDMSEGEMKAEARSCFESLGNLLQNRRKLDLLNIHSYYLKSQEDPAAKSSTLNEKLIEHKSEASKAISSLCQKYVKLQEEGKEVDLSEDSDDSNYESSEDESEK